TAGCFILINYRNVLSGFTSYTELLQDFRVFLLRETSDFILLAHLGCGGAGAYLQRPLSERRGLPWVGCQSITTQKHF
ncbi:hypothetical protein CHARACLAT_005657, partial [Characodon lateralis]|nr:hypothetical protein [Characodon lateralis]